MSETADPRGREFLGGDGLRAIAALSVLVFHVTIDAAKSHKSPGDTLNSIYGGATNWLTTLSTGLFVFFVLTGYLIGGRYARAWVSGGSYPQVGTFIKKRVRRIVPLFWLMGIVTVIVYGTMGTSLPRVAALFGFAQVYWPSAFEYKLGQAWTLDVEMTFYVALPLVALLLARVPLKGRTPEFRAVLLSVVVLLAGFVSMKLYVRGDPGVTLARSLPGLFWAFSPGIILGALEPVLAHRFRGARPAKWLAWTMIGMSALAYLTLTGLTGGQLAQRAVAIYVCAGGLVGGVMVHQWVTGRGLRWLDNRAMHALGRWSFGIYLTHLVIEEQLLNHVIKGDPIPAFLLGLAISIPVTVGVSAALWRYWEKPFMEGELPWRRVQPAATAPVAAEA